MKVLGLTLWKKKPEQQSTFTAEQMDALSQLFGAMKAQSVPGRPGVREIKTMKRHRITDQIIFPEPLNTDDVWSVQQLTNLVDKVEKMFTQGWIDICEVDSAVRNFKLRLTGPSKQAYEKLRILHCVHFDKYLPGIYDQIPSLMTCVFTEGRAGFGQTGSSEQTVFTRIGD
jgi:hypothetical protein